MSERRKQRGHKKQRARELSGPHISITTTVCVGDDRAGSVPAPERAQLPEGGVEPRRRRRGRRRRGPWLDRLVQRLFPSLDPPTIRWICSALRTGLIALATFLIPVIHDRGVDADELMQRASQAERLTPLANRVVQLTFVRQDTGETVRIVRQVGARSPASPKTAAPDDVPAVFRPALEAIGLDWQRLLTIDTAVLFRSAHRLDRDERVTRVGNGALFVLSTTASPTLTGALRDMQVGIDAESYQVLQEHLTFPGIGTLDLEDLSRSAAYLPRRAGSTGIRPSRDDLERAELRVRLLLADTGADLEQRVQIVQSPQSVRVQTDGDGSRWDPLAKQLHALAHVHVELSVPGTGTHVVPTDALPTTYGLERSRKRRFGHSASGASVLPKLMESIVTVRQRLTVLAELAKRYRDPRHDLSNEARALLGQLVGQHYGRLRGELNSVKDGVFGFWGPVRLRQEGKTAPISFVAHSGVALARAHTMETAVRTAIAQHDLTSEQEQRVRDAFQSLWESVHGKTPARRDGDWCVQDDRPGGDSKATCGMPRR